VVGRDETMAGEMLAAIGHAGQRQAVIEALGQQHHHARIAMEGTVADHAGDAVIGSSTGVNDRSMPQARSSAASTKPVAVASLVACSTSRSHDC
jgi:hypothetical protein